jgi:DNA topoisomerase-1
VPLPPSDPVEAAAAAGLRYATDRGPGIRRRRAGRGWRYLGPDGAPIRDPRTLKRIRALAIPPAYADVWINPDPHGHLQATGRDARGRKQYRYHPRWRATRDETKFGRLVAFGQALPAIRARVDEDLARPGLPREKALATVVRLLEATLIRVGNEEYARQNDSYGLTTLRNEHAAVAGATVRFAFRGKGGKEHEVDVRDRRLAGIVRRCQELPGQTLFGYRDEAGEPQAVASEDVNAYLREIAGQEFTAKDFRTWAGTVLAAEALRDFTSVDTEDEAKQNVVRAIDAVAARLGNTRAVCRMCYVHPAILDGYLDGSLVETLRRRVVAARHDDPPGLAPEGAAVLAFLRDRPAAEADERRPAA